MDIREYRYIIEVVDQGGITKAASTLYISQPSLSMYIKNLEKKLGFVFFEKVEGKNVLTSEGELYVDYARRITRLNDELYKQLDKISQLKSGLVRIGITRMRGAALLPVLLPLLHKKYPGIHVQVVEATSQRLEELVCMRELDFILINFPFREKDLSHIDLFSEEILAAIPANNPICKEAISIDGIPHRWIDIKLLANEKFILLKQGQKIRQIADELFLKASITPNILLETSNAETALNLSRVGEGISFILDFLCKSVSNSKDIEFFSIGSPQVFNKFVIAYPHESYISIAGRAVIDVIQDTFKY